MGTAEHLCFVHGNFALLYERYRTKPGESRGAVPGFSSEVSSQTSGAEASENIGYLSRTGLYRPSVLQWTPEMDGNGGSESYCLYPGGLPEGRRRLPKAVFRADRRQLRKYFWSDSCVPELQTGSGEKQYGGTASLSLHTSSYQRICHAALYAASSQIFVGERSGGTNAADGACAAGQRRCGK